MSAFAPVRGPRLRVEDYLVLGAVLFLPWAFGGVVLWGHRTSALLLIAAAAWAVTRDGPRGLGLDRRARWLLPAVLLGVWAGMQLVPLPPRAIRTLSPAADELYRETFPGYGGQAPLDPAEALEARALAAVPEAQGLPLPERPAEPAAWKIGGRWRGWRPLSLLPSAGAERLFWYAALLAGFLVVRRRCSERRVAKVYRTALLSLFGALGLFGLVYAVTANGKLYWLYPTFYPVTPAGPYVNPNHFSGALELGTPWLLGYTVSCLRRRSRNRTTIAWWIGASVSCVAAGLVAGSRSYTVLLAVSVVLMVGLSLNRRRDRALWAVFVAAAIIAVPLVSMNVLPGPVSGEQSRILNWKSGFAMLGDFPVTGTGFGSFRDAFPHYRAAGATKRFEKMHNDYLQVVVEGGAVAAILLAWLICGWAVRLGRLGTRRLAGRESLASAGLLVGLIVLSLHASWDFNHQIPANALLFVTLAGMAVARVDEARA